MRRYQAAGLTSRSPLRRSRPLPLEEHNWRYHESVPGTVTVDEARAALGDVATERQVGRLRFERQVALGRVPLEESERIVATRRHWFDPDGQPCAVAFLPEDRAWAAPAYLSYVRSGHDDALRSAMVAAAREWLEHWGAELVAAWGTMLQFSVTRPPRDPGDAWVLAGQLLDAGRSVQEHRCYVAQDLVGADAWFLHDRP